MPTQNATTWRLKGTVLQACNCDYGCPCNFNARPTYGDCEGGYSWHVEEGQYGGVRLDGLGFGFFADWPGAVHEGNAEALLLIDERADEAQRGAIQTLLSGKTGGPWAIFANTFTKIHGPRFVRYELSPAGDRTSLRIGDEVQLVLEPIRNPVSGKEMHPRVVLPEGIVFKDAGMVASKTFRVRDGVSYDHSGKYAAFAQFEYSGPAAA